MSSDSHSHALSRECSGYWWKDYFDAPTIALYRELLPSALAELEAQTIRDILQLPVGARVLDVCCGYGRHLIPLVRKGYCMTGVDISSIALQETKWLAQNEGFKINLARADMRALPCVSYYDAAILMFNSFGIFDECDNKICLLSIHRALKSGGIFLLETPNRSYVEALYDNDVRHEVFEGHELEMHVFTRLDHSTNFLRQEIRWRNGFGEYSKSHAFRMYTMSEIEQLLLECGFNSLRFYAGLLGEQDEKPDSKIVVRGIVSPH